LKLTVIMLNCFLESTLFFLESEYIQATCIRRYIVHFYEQLLLHYIESTICIESVVEGVCGHVRPPVYGHPCVDLGFVTFINKLETICNMSYSENISLHIIAFLYCIYKS